MLTCIYAWGSLCEYLSVCGDAAPFLSIPVLRYSRILTVAYPLNRVSLSILWTCILLWMISLFDLSRLPDIVLVCYSAAMVIGLSAVVVLGIEAAPLRSKVLPFMCLSGEVEQAIVIIDPAYG